MMIRRFLSSENGSGMAELAVVMVVFTLLLLGSIEFGLIYWHKSTVVAAAREGARFAIVRGAESGHTADTASVAAYVRGRTSLTPLNVTTTWSGSKDPGAIVEVRVGYIHRPASPLPGLFTQDSIPIVSTSKMVVVF